jgi:hypothetical protein
MLLRNAYLTNSNLNHSKVVEAMGLSVRSLLPYSKQLALVSMVASLPLCRFALK